MDSGPLPPAIQAHEVVKAFGSRRALDGVSFEVPAGQVSALLGPNGAGKTTMIHVLLGLTLPTSGRVSLLGHDHLGRPAAAAAGQAG